MFDLLKCLFSQFKTKPQAPAVDCCCPAATVTCGDCAIPETLTVTTSSPCAALNGKTWTVTHNGSEWTGETVDGNFRYRASLFCVDGVLQGNFGVWYEPLYPCESDATLCNCIAFDSSFTVASFDCDPFEASAEVGLNAGTTSPVCDDILGCLPTTLTLTFTE